MQIACKLMEMKRIVFFFFRFENIIFVPKRMCCVHRHWVPYEYSHFSFVYQNIANAYECRVFFSFAYLKWSSFRFYDIWTTHTHTQNKCLGQCSLSVQHTTEYFPWVCHSPLILCCFRIRPYAHTYWYGSFVFDDFHLKHKLSYPKSYFLVWIALC